MTPLVGVDVNDKIMIDVSTDKGMTYGPPVLLPYKTDYAPAIVVHDDALFIAFTDQGGHLKMDFLAGLLRKKPDPREFPEEKSII